MGYSSSGTETFLIVGEVRVTEKKNPIQSYLHQNKSTWQLHPLKLEIQKQNYKTHMIKTPEELKIVANWWRNDTKTCNM